MSHIISSVGTIVVVLHDGGVANSRPHRVQFNDAWVEAEAPPWGIFSVYGDRDLPRRALGHFSAPGASWWCLTRDGIPSEDAPDAEPQGAATVVRFDHHTRFVLHGWGCVNDSLFGGVALLDGDETLSPATLRAALVDDGAALCMTFARAGRCQCRALLLTPIAGPEAP